MNPMEAAKELGMYNGTVRRLVKLGILHDKSHKRRKGHRVILDREEVEKLKTLNPTRFGKIKNGAITILKDGMNGNHKTPSAPKQLFTTNVEVPSKHKPLHSLSEINSRLDKIEKKLEQLIQMWS
jgi:hypothetical protein